MGLRLRVVDGGVEGRVHFDRRQEGAPGFAHGGAVATVLDDAFGSVLVVVEKPAVTANLTVDFRAPVFLDRDLLVHAWCERIEGRKIHLAGELREHRTVLAEARALFVEVDIDHFRRGGRELPDRWTSWGEAGSRPGAP